MNRKIQLRPLVASYLAESASATRHALNNHALDVITQVAKGTVDPVEMEPALLDTLIEMRVFRKVVGRIYLDTAVFLEEDIEAGNRLAIEYGEGLAERVIPAAAALRELHPNVLNFLVGIVAIGQSLHYSMKADGLAVDWSQWGGRFAKSKVDFEEVCEASGQLGPDLQTKGLAKGTQFTAVLIGPGENSYLLKPTQLTGKERGAYIHALNPFLTDAFPLLLTGRLDHPALRNAAEQVGLCSNGQPESLVITNETLQPYISTLDEIAEINRAFAYSQLDRIHAFLCSTASGRQGVPVQNMNMHLWRYLRRGVARALYSQGVFTDRVSETGSITVFYENNVEYLKQMFR